MYNKGKQRRNTTQRHNTTQLVALHPRIKASVYSQYTLAWGDCQLGFSVVRKKAEKAKLSNVKVIIIIIDNTMSN